MNKSFATYTPRVRPLEYDAIRGRTGCEPESGSTFFGLKAFEELCVANHDAASAVFNQPATVSYSFGPYYKGIPQAPYLSLWTAWVATQGVRAGKVGPITPPSNLLGEPSSLYPDTTPEAITHAWDEEGLLAIAIQKDADTIELKQYEDTNPAGPDVDTFTWPGVSPALFYSGNVVKTDPPQTGLVCYYLKPEENARRVYARFEADAYATERIVMPSLRVGLSRLIGASSFETKVQLFAIDEDGRDITLTSPRHDATGADAATLGTALEGGTVYVLGIEGGSFGPDNATLDIAAPFGQVFSPLVDPANPPPADAASLSVALVGGEVS